MSKHSYALLLLLGIGCLMLITGGIWLYQNTLLIRTGTETQGVVLKNVPRARGYTAQIEFFAEDGTVHQFLASGSSNPPMYQPHDQILVFYDAANPTRATVDDMFIFFGPSMLLLTGAVQCLLALALRKKDEGSI